jgi:hypothetical protein
MWCAAMNETQTLLLGAVIGAWLLSASRAIINTMFSARKHYWEKYWLTRLGKARRNYEETHDLSGERISGPDLQQLHMLLDRVIK